MNDYILFDNSNYRVYIENQLINTKLDDTKLLGTLMGYNIDINTHCHGMTIDVIYRFIKNDIKIILDFYFGFISSGDYILHKIMVYDESNKSYSENDFLKAFDRVQKYL